ncbi:glycosyltransferase family 2 protein, partial [Flavobacterium sp.]|uniref:glycosyltransferase family 2 protein n=1 Tax=Flavobacterium sp. TaxID=239 RepID=UPI0038FCEFD6
HRGLTKQRNYGIERVGTEIEVVCFLDDDIVLEKNYFEQLLKTYEIYPEALGVGGYIINETKSEYVGDNYQPRINEYYFDGWKRRDSSRFILRKILGLDSGSAPGYYPNFAHERSVSFLPPSGKIYEVEMLMGGVSSFKKSVFEIIRFSTYFEGYGLYEDADFTLRLSQFGKLYINSSAKLCHYHEESGRPNRYQYGKMVVRNGWYVWRIKNPAPEFKSKLKWNSITLLLTLIRFFNTFSSTKRIAAFSESIGRIVGWCSLFWDKPKNLESNFRVVKQIQLVCKGKRIDILPLGENLLKTPIRIPAKYQKATFEIEIIFRYPIEKIRNSDYQWIDSDKDFIATQLVPKILKLSNGFFIQPNTAMGVWEYNKKCNNKITWKFNQLEASALTKFTRITRREFLSHKHSNPIDFQEDGKVLSLLFSKEGAVEFSRSKIPFSAVACFTDHCDFDTLENLKLQRELLKECGVKITKGFFLNHFSKRDNSVSWQNNAAELKKWSDEGHELAYHSLSQSIKSDENSANDFVNFKPVENVVTWIDHGYQPYNFSLFESTNIIDKNTYFKKLDSVKITNIWNYIDSGTSTSGIINQLNPSHFTLYNYWKGIKGISFFNKIQQFIKNCFYHYYSESNLIEHYKLVSQNIKDIVFYYRLKDIPILLYNGTKVLLPLLKVIIFWKNAKIKHYRYAKYNSIIFPYIENGKLFRIFQTIDMLDLIKSLAPENIDLLVNENGLFIAHTYFSVPMKYHTGRMFETEDSIDNKVLQNFIYLGKKITNNEIWNPTLNELIVYLSNFEKVILDVDSKGNIIVVNDSDLHFRTVN